MKAVSRPRSTERLNRMRYEDFISTDASNDNVQYIHELQNVIQMAKVDKEIKL